MKNYLIYDGSGKIIQTGIVPDEMLELQAAPDKGRYVMEGSADASSEYVVSGAVVARPSSPVVSSAASVTADGVDEVVLWCVPAGAHIAVQGPLAMSGTADGSNVRLTFATPGNYLVGVRLFPFQDWEVAIHAV